jgi:hypothetical protein
LDGALGTAGLDLAETLDEPAVVEVSFDVRQERRDGRGFAMSDNARADATFATLPVKKDIEGVLLVLHRYDVEVPLITRAVDISCEINALHDMLLSFSVAIGGCG